MHNGNDCSDIGFFFFLIPNVILIFAKVKFCLTRNQMEGGREDCVTQSYKLGLMNVCRGNLHFKFQLLPGLEH